MATSRAAAQRQPVAQRARRMGKDLKDDSTFGDPSAGLMEHLKGEWTGSGGGAPTGGHWKDGMKSKWGGFHTGGNDADKKGVHLHKDASLSNDRPTLSMKNWMIKGDTKESGNKASSFWPAAWKESDLKGKLKDSDEVNVSLSGGRKQWVSQKPNPLVWESYNKDTAYPIKPN